LGIFVFWGGGKILVAEKKPAAKKPTENNLWSMIVCCGFCLREPRCSEKLGSVQSLVQNGFAGDGRVFRKLGLS
jgi:hypothetical protein